MSEKDPKAKILIVDDTPENIDILGNVLKPYYRRVVALNGVKALEIARSASPPDLILLDIMMPEMDGYEVCRRLKMDGICDDIPVIFVTAKTGVEDEAMGFELGAVDYITKPISPPIVLARVRTHLELRRARQILQNQNRELLEAARLRDDVDNIMRHDLKGPLTSIIGMPQLIKLTMEPGQEIRQAVDSIEESGYMMLNMINLSLDLFKMERGTYAFKPQPTDLKKLFTKIIKDQESFVRYKKLSFAFTINGRGADESDEFTVMAEELLAYSLFSNLVKNAVEAAPEETSIDISLSEESGFGRAVLANKGAVPLEIRERFFEKYVTAGKRGGTGLGAYSARLMAVTMQGDINLESSDELGAEITVRLPAALDTSASGRSHKETPDPAHSSDEARLRVLAVDDDPHGRRLIRHFLTRPGIQVDTAENGRQGLELITSTRYDLVFMDVEMPVMDGLEAVSRLRDREAERGDDRIPVIALTGHDSPAAVSKLLAAGFTNHLSKPVTSADLGRILNNPAESASVAQQTSTPEPDDDGPVKVDLDFQGMVESFLADNRKALDGLILKGQEVDLEKMAGFGHTLAGTGSMYGLRRLGRMGKELEAAAREGRGRDLPALLAELAEYMDGIVIEFVEED